MVIMEDVELHASEVGKVTGHTNSGIETCLVL